MTTVVHGLDTLLVQRVRALVQPAFSGELLLTRNDSNAYEFVACGRSGGSGV